MLPLNRCMDEKIKQATKNPARSKAMKAVAQNMAVGAKEVKATVHEESKPKVGQPTKFNPELWERILVAVATYQDLIEICGEPDMPAVSTVYRWMRERPELKEDMRGAWEMFSYLGKSYNNNILRGGRMSTQDFRRDEALVSDNRWFMSKTNRRDFGDRQQIDVTVQEPFVLEAWMLPGSTQKVIDVKPDTDSDEV
jgi:hypothetical protein